MASHDLQEPLRKIKILSDRIAEKCAGNIDEQGKDYIQKLQSACSRMQNLIRDILDFSKVAVDLNSLIYSDVNKLLDEVQAEMEIKIQEKNAKLVIAKLPHLNVNPTLIKSLFQKPGQ